MQSYAAMVEKQRNFFQTQTPRDLSYRNNALHRLKHVIQDNESKILEALRQDLGKNQFEAFTSEVGIVLGEIRNAQKHLKRYALPQRRPTPLYLWPSKSRIIYEPLGVCLIISPWNYPFQLTMAPLIGAVAAGNCAVLKPSERSLHTSKLIYELIDNTFPPEHVTTILADKTEAAGLLQEPFDSFFFTGSKGVGQIIYDAAAKRMVPVTLELGGKNPCIVEPDADLDITAQRIAWGKFYNAGQTCVAPDYLLVHKDVKEPLVEKLIASVRHLFGDDPRESAAYGRLIDTAHMRHLERLLSGLTIRLGGTFSTEERYMSPTIATEVTMDDKVMEDEIFGPILPLLSYRTIEEAQACIRSIPKSLALYLFTRSKRTQQHIFESCSFGGGCINDTLVHFSSPHLPVGGIGQSGIGRYRGTESFRAFSNMKTIVHTPFFPNMTLRYPPFSEWKMSLVKRFMR
ncbi:MAG: aldehyde dehydrogenase [Deltaproteobacteria bacterium]|nr:aldehyde dehydrogenase [Deltaproteobacteria bacterium]MBN2672001.1 aldehyde dehydrogenase [Deltaproteobacteria bacterium]